MHYSSKGAHMCYGSYRALIGNPILAVEPTRQRVWPPKVIETDRNLSFRGHGDDSLFSHATATSHGSELPPVTLTYTRRHYFVAPPSPSAHSATHHEVSVALRYCTTVCHCSDSSQSVVNSAPYRDSGAILSRCGISQSTLNTDIVFSAQFRATIRHCGQIEFHVCLFIADC